MVDCFLVRFTVRLGRLPVERDNARDLDDVCDCASEASLRVGDTSLDAGMDGSVTGAEGGEALDSTFDFSVFFTSLFRFVSSVAIGFGLADGGSGTFSCRRISPAVFSAAGLGPGTLRIGGEDAK